MEMTPTPSRSNPKASLIFGFGNVLLDKVVSVGADFLSKYDLEPNTTTLLTKEEDVKMGIFEELEKPDLHVTLCVGGCAANSLRVAQWILRASEGRTAFVGAVGSDEDSLRLRTLMSSEGILMRGQTVENAATGKCAVLTNSEDSTRTLVTQLGASVKFCHEDWLKKERDFFERNCGLIFVSGYFLVVSVPTVKSAAVEFGCQKGVPVVLALNAVWVVTTLFKDIAELMPYVDYLIGNSEEMRALGNMYGIQTENLSTITNYLQQVPKNGRPKRTVICTDGESPVVVSVDGLDQRFPVIAVKPEDIKDTNGAGDAFTGGLLAGILQRRPLSECTRCGLWAASQVLQHTGCNFPKEKSFTWSD